MNRLPFLRGFLRTLVGLPERTSPWYFIDRTTTSDIDRARWKRSLRESAKSSQRMLRRYFDHLQSGGSGLEFMLDEFPQLREPPPARPIVVSPEVYRLALAKSGASLRSPRRSLRGTP